MSEYYQEKIVESYQCANCGGAVMKTGCAPLVKGSLMRFRCIRCNATGGRRAKLTWDEPKVRGEVERC